MSGCIRTVVELGLTLRWVASIAEKGNAVKEVWLQEEEGGFDRDRYGVCEGEGRKGRS